MSAWTAMIVPEEGELFPALRRALCCDKQCKAGESVLVLRTECGKLVQQHVLHRKCLLNQINQMPLDRQEYRSAFAKMRAKIVATGKPFPMD